MKEGRSAFKILAGKLTGKRPSEMTRRKWENSIRMEFKKIGIITRNWVDSTQDRDYWRTVVNASWNFGFHKPWNCLISFCACNRLKAPGNYKNAYSQQ